eukprot:m.208237 g.208237  ORF g.208237 m.208237 type:complete len:81 (-) comp18960_c0_seq3:8-250(-)
MKQWNRSVSSVVSDPASTTHRRIPRCGKKDEAAVTKAATLTLKNNRRRIQHSLQIRTLSDPGHACCFVCIYHHIAQATIS